MCGILMGLIYEFFRILRVTLFPSSVETSKNVMKQLPSNSAETAFVLREESAKNSYATYVFNIIVDVIFGIIGGIFAAVLIFHTNRGEVRWFALAGCALGFAAYMLTFGKIIFRVYLKIKIFVFKIVKKILSILFLPIILPLKAIIRKVKKILKTIKLQNKNL